MPKPIPLPSKAGIKRDGSVTEGEYFTEGKWCRFTPLGKAAKMGGYKLIRDNTSGPVRGMKVYTQQGEAYIFTGSADSLECQLTDMQGNIAGGTRTRTPAGLPTNNDYVWQFDAIYDPAGGNNLILAHAAPNLSDIDNTYTGSLYYGTMTDTAALVASGAPAVSGGVCVLHPYTFVFGSDGRVSWPVAGTLTYTGGDSGSARVAATKIIRGMRVRGGVGGSPAGLLFALDSVIKASYIGGTAIWSFDVVADEITPLSSRGMIDYDGIIMWPTSDRFVMFSGVIREIPNNLNINFFFNNLKCANRQKVFAFKIPRWNEIWWCFPKGNATECDHAIIHNPVLNTWYDTPLPEGGRTDAYFPTVFRYPIMVGADPASSDGKYSLWQHEYRSAGQNQYDKVYGNRVDAIESYCTTADISMILAGIDRNAFISSIYPDILQSGLLRVEWLYRPFPRSPDAVGAVQDFAADEVQLNNIRSEGMYGRLKFTSNVQGGYYEMGDNILNIDVGSGRPAGA